jgi:hypothetical protein
MTKTRSRGRPRIMPKAVADRQRATRRSRALSHATALAGLQGRLKAHARRCRTEAGYKTIEGLTRQACARALVSLAEKLISRQQLGLSLRWWVDKATGMLEILDRQNATTGDSHG